MINNEEIKKLSDYDTTMKDLENEIKSIVAYLDTQKKAFSTSFYFTISALTTSLRLHFTVKELPHSGHLTV